MPRKARVLVAGCPHHIVQRGHNREAVFLADEDYQFYLENLREWKEKLAIKVYGWCLMANHVYLIVEPCKKARMFVDEIERRTGMRIERRSRGRPGRER